MINDCGAAGGMELTVASVGTSSSTAYKPSLTNSVKTLVNNSDGLNYLKQKFLKLSDAKLKEGVFSGPHIRKVLHKTIMNSQLHSIRCIFKSLVYNKKEENYKQMREKLQHDYNMIGLTF
jgi:hypothetical protein